MSLEAPPGIAILDPNITAAGTTQATATSVDALTSIVMTVPAGSGVMILAAGLYTQVIVNNSANPLLVYPRPNMAFGQQAVNLPVALAAGRSMGHIVASPTQAYVIFTVSSFG